MSSREIQDAKGNVVHIAGTGAGTPGDPFIPEIVFGTDDSDPTTAIAVQDPHGNIWHLAAVGAGTAASPFKMLVDAISDDADNALELGTDDKLYAASGGGGGVQFISGTTNPPTDPPTDANAAAHYYNTSTKFSWNWNIGAQAWVAVPRVYRALLTQSGTNAPVATVLENTLGGTVVWTRNQTGQHLGTLAGAFTAGKTFVSCHSNMIDEGGVFVLCTRYSGDTVSVNVYVNDQSSDDYLIDMPIEVLVYP